MNEDFGRTIQKQLEFYNGPQADQFAQVHKKLDDVKNVSGSRHLPPKRLATQVMVQNIEMVLERGEKLELLVDKSEQLQLDSFRFQKSSKKLRQAMFWKKVKIYLLVFFVIVVILYVFLAVVCVSSLGPLLLEGPRYCRCGPAFSKCKEKK